MDAIRLHADGTLSSEAPFAGLLRMRLELDGVGDGLPELRFFRLRDMLDAPLKMGTARHVLLGETAAVLDAATSFTVFDLLEGIGWELGFQGGSLTCNLKE